MKLTFGFVLTAAFLITDSAASIHVDYMPAEVSSKNQLSSKLFFSMQRELLLAQWFDKMLENRKKYQLQMRKKQMSLKRSTKLADNMPVRLMVWPETEEDWQELGLNEPLKCHSPCAVERYDSIRYPDLRKLSPYPDPPAANSEQYYPHIFLTTHWIRWDYVQVVHDSLRWKNDPDLHVPRQIYGVINRAAIPLVDKQPLAEDLSKIELLISHSRHSDVRLPAPPVVNHAQQQSSSATQAVNDAETDSTVHFFIRKLPADRRDVIASMCEPEGWYIPYIRELASMATIRNIDDQSCAPISPPAVFTNLSNENKDNYDDYDEIGVQLIMERHPLPDQVSGRLVEALNHLRENQLIFYFGHWQLPWQPEWHQVSFTGRDGRQESISVPRLPVVPVWVFDDGPEQAIAYFSFLRQHPELIKKYHGGWGDDSFVQNGDNNTDGHGEEEHWACAACQYFRKHFTE